MRMWPVDCKDCNSSRVPSQTVEESSWTQVKANQSTGGRKQVPDRRMCKHILDLKVANKNDFTHLLVQSSNGNEAAGHLLQNEIKSN